jgi:hypothetical protein
VAVEIEVAFDLEDPGARAPALRRLFGRRRGLLAAVAEVEADEAALRIAEGDP